MIESKKVKKLLIILFLSILLISAVISFDSMHLSCCHEKKCTRCDIIRSSINLLNSVKSILFVIIIMAIITDIIEYEIKRNISLEKITLVKNKVVMLE